MRRLKLFSIATLTALLTLAAGCSQEASMQAEAQTPALTSDQSSSVSASAYEQYVDNEGNISLPQNIATDWAHMGSWAVAKDGGVEGLHNVYAPKEDIEHFRSTGEFADGAVMVKEVRAARGAAHTTGDAHWAKDIQVWFIMVKDTQGRFADNPLWGDGWGWALYEGKDPTKQVATDYKKDCLGCHIPAKDTDWTYVYGYPALGADVAQFAPQDVDAASAAAAAMTSMAADASGDTMAGEEVFARCASCHSLTPGQHGVGPSLAGLVGRKAGAAEGYNYSSAMAASDVVWSAETLDAHLANVPGFIPGNRMATFFPGGVQDPEERANLVAYLMEAGK